MDFCHKKTEEARGGHTATATRSFTGIIYILDLVILLTRKQEG
jgi:hypothetical protein